MRNFIQNLKSLKSLKSLMHIFNMASEANCAVEGRKMGCDPLTNLQGFSNLSLTFGSFRPRFTLDSILSRICLASLILMVFGVGEAWALDEYETVTDFDSYTTFSGSATSGTGLQQVTAGTFSATQNHVTFTIDNLNKYDNNRLVYADQVKNSTFNSTFSWNAASNYSVSVTGITMKVRGYSAVKYPASAQFEGNTKRTCTTNSTGTNGSTDVSASTGLSGSSIIFHMYNEETGGITDRTVAFTLHDIKYTYKVTHRRYLYGFNAVIGGVNNESYGSATASGSATVGNDFTTTTASKQVTYTATVSDGTQYKFLGWYRDADCTVFESSANPYTPTLENSTAGTIVTKTLYAKFGEKGIPSVTCDIQDTYEIGHAALDLASLWYTESAGTVTYSIVDDLFTPSGTNNEGATAPVLSDGTLSLGQAGSLTLQMSIAAAGDFRARTETKKITIYKKANPFTNTVRSTNNVWETTMGFDDEIAFTYSSTNPAATSSITQIAGTDTATYVSASNKITSNFRKGTAKWHLSQPETYQYEAGNDTLVVHVAEAARPVGYLFGPRNFAKDTTFSEVGTMVSWSESGATDSLFFEMKKNGGGGNGKVYRSNSSGWTNDTTVYEGNKEWASRKIALSASATGVNFAKAGAIGTDDPYIKNIRVTRKQWFKIKNAAGDAEITELTMPKRTTSGDSTEMTFKVDYSTCASSIKVVSNNSHIVVKAGDRSFSSTTHGVKTVTLRYASDEEETITDAIVTIYTPYEHKTLTVSAQTKDQLATTIEYFGERSYSVTESNKAATSVFRVRDENGTLVATPTITLTSSDSAKIDIVSVNTLDFKCGGSARITASYAGGGTYAEAADLDTLITVNKLSDEIVWQGVNAEDGMIHVYAGSDLSNLVASAHTSIANYESGNSDKLSVTRPISAFKISALKKGEVTLTATSAGDCEYESVSDTKTIKIDECPHNIVWNQNLVGLLADAEGNINDTIILTACAVDSAGTATNKPVTYSFEEEEEYARIHEDTLFVTGMAEVTINVTTAEDDKYAIAKASKRLRVRRFGDACGSEVVDSEEHAVGAWDNASGKTYKNLPPSDKIYITVGKYRDAATNTLYIYGYTDANCTTGQKEIASYAAGDLSTSGADKEIDISAADYRSIKIKAGGTISKWYKNLRITQKTYLTASVSSISDDDITVGDAISKSFTVDYSDKPVLNYRYTGDYLSLTPNKTVDNDCGDYGTYTFTLSGSVPVASEIKDTIWITTSALDTIRIPVALTVSAGDTVVFTGDNAEWSADETTATTPVTVSRAVTITEPVEAYSVTIGVGGSLTIAPTGGLTVYAGGISDATVDNLTLSVETADVASHGQTGFLRVSPMAEMPQAKVQMLRLGYSNGNTSTQLGVVGDMNWQYVGAPIVAPGTKIKSIVGGWIYSWDEEDGDWINNKSTLEVAPFHGFANSQSANANGAVTNFKGQLVSNGTHYVDLAYTSETKGWNLLANSFAAPMDMTKMGSGCFPEGMDATVYLFNTGSTYNSSETQDGPGRYTTVPINLAGTTVGGYTYPTVIPSMQGFFVRAAAAETQMTFDYTRLVWNTTASNRPIRVRATNPTNEYETLFITLISGSQSDDVQIIANEDRFSPKFENGYDAHVKASAINIYTVNEDEEYLSVDATDRIIGTQIGIRTNDNMVYTMRFTNVHSDQNLALQDHIEDRTIELYEGAEYMFYAVPNSDVIGRFEIVQSYGSSQITTDIEDHQDKITVQKFIQDGQLYVLKDGVLYNAMGNRVR